jgi:transcriptional regulator with XRE-family HTH domain
MRIEGQNTDEVVLAELGRRLARGRLDANLSQKQLAQEAGVSKATVERLEAGDPVKSNVLIRVLRALGRLDAIDRLVPEPLPSPVERLELEGRRRQRAGRKNEEREARPWRWGDEPAAEDR